MCQNEGFYVLTDGHVMKATAIAFDLELMKLLEVQRFTRIVNLYNGQAR